MLYELFLVIFEEILFNKECRGENGCEWRSKLVGGQ